MDSSQRNVQVMIPGESAAEDSRGKSLTPSPSSIPSLAFSASDSRSSHTDLDSDIDALLTDLSRATRPQAPHHEEADNDSFEKIEYEYELGSPKTDGNLSSRARNRASGGFFRRLLRRRGPPSPRLNPIADPIVNDNSFDILNERTDPYESADTPRETDAWPLPSSPPSQPTYFPESPVLGPGRPPIQATSKSELPPTILDPSDFALDLESVLSEYSSDNTAKAASSVVEPTIRTPRLPPPLKPLPMLPQIPSFAPLFPRHKSATNTNTSATQRPHRQPSLTRTLHLFPSPPSHSPCPSPTPPKAKSKNRFSHLPHPLLSESPSRHHLPSRSLNQSAHFRHRSRSSFSQTTALVEEEEEKERQMLIREEEEQEKRLREQDLAEYSLRYEDAPRRWEPFRSLRAAELSGGGSGFSGVSVGTGLGAGRDRERERAGRRSFGCLWI